MSSAGPLVLIGGGGHCKSCLDVLELEGTWSILGILDRKDRIGQRVLGYPVVGEDRDIARFVGEGCRFLVTIGQIKTCETRVRVFDLVRQAGGSLATVVSPLARVSRHATIGEGTIVMHFALVNADAKVGTNSIVNTAALVEHDAVVEDHCHIATGARVNGGAHVAKGCLVGSGAVMLPGTRLGPGEILAAGSVKKGDRQ